MLEFIQYVKRFEACFEEYSMYPTPENWQKLLEAKAIVHYLCYSSELSQPTYIPGEKIKPCLN